MVLNPANFFGAGGVSIENLHRCGCHRRLLRPYFGVYFSDPLPNTATAPNRMDAGGVFGDSTEE